MSLESVAMRCVDGTKLRLISYLEENPLALLQNQHIDSWLAELENFFQIIGGIAGLQETMQSLLEPIEAHLPETILFNPTFVSLEKTTFETGILFQNEIVEIIVLGGAAERLQFVDENTGEPLPAFLYPLMGKPLLRWLIEEIEAKEERYYHLTGEKICTPIVLMTSGSKNNCLHLERYLEAQHWFGRPPASFHFLKQPSVPYIDREGHWLVQSTGLIEKNPCGHGALWFLLEKEKVFQQTGFDKPYGLVRQINNPLVAHFSSMGSFVATAREADAPFAILVTDPLEGAKEGRVVRLANGLYTNIEYTSQYTSQGWDQATGFANVNALFFSWEKIRPTILNNPYPGCLLNFKGGAKARLEMSMQNLMDNISDVAICHLSRSFAIKAIKSSGTGVETRQAAFDHLQQLYQEKMGGVAESVFYLHTFLTQSFDWWQKSSAHKSFVKLDLCDVRVNHVQIEGALIVHGKGTNCELSLENVEIVNKGIDWGNSDVASGQIRFLESFQIIFEGSGKCILKNLQIVGGTILRIQEGEEKNSLGTILENNP